MKGNFTAGPLKHAAISFTRHNVGTKASKIHKILEPKSSAKERKEEEAEGAFSAGKLKKAKSKI